MAAEDKIINQIIKRHGDVIDLRKEPEKMIDILRRFRLDPPPNGGSPPGGTPPTSVVAAEDPTTRDVYKELLKLAKEIRELRKQLG